MKTISHKLTSFLILGGLLFLSSSFLHAQSGSNVIIDKITVEKGELNFWVKSLENGRLNEELTREQIEIVEHIGGSEIQDTLEIFELIDTVIVRNISSNSTTNTIYILLDLSKEIDNEALINAKSLIKDLVLERHENSNSTIYLTAFHETEVLKHKEINSDNVDNILSTLNISDYSNPDFYRILAQTIRQLKGESGVKALFVFGSGVNVSTGPIYELQLPVELSDIASIMESAFEWPNYYLFNIGLTGENSFSNFQLLPSGEVQFSDGALPEGYDSKLKNNREVLSNFLVKAFPSARAYRGENRSYELSLREEMEDYTFGNPVSTLKDFRLGSINYPIGLQQQPSWGNWWLLFVSGLLVISAILGFGSLIVPYIKERDFMKRHVKAYVQEEGRVRYDIFYNEPIQPGELVVDKCRQVTPFSSWKENGWQCPNYPICLDQSCNGAGAPVSNNFSSMEGHYLQLNWVLFGAIGGLLAWVTISLFRMTEVQILGNTIRYFLGDAFLKGISQDNPDLVIETISNNLSVGIAFAFGLTFMLSWMEERRASNRYSIISSIQRIFVRTFLGVLLAMIAFFFGFYLQYVVGMGAFWSGVVSWLLFGISIGLIMSIQSTIPWSNGMIGGTFGAVIAFGIYYLGVSSFLNFGFLQANLLSMVIMGGLIGSMLVTVVSSLEDFELEVIAPAGYQRTIPISKWLKSNVGVTIGKANSCYVYVKWDDADVHDEHAELKNENGSIYIKPIEEVLVNRRMISKPVALKSGDIIQLGRSGTTQFRFLEK